MPACGSLDVAVVHQGLSNRDLRELSGLIRRDWPKTQILLIHENSEALDDSLFDECARPGLTAEGLLLMIERLSMDARIKRKIAGPSRSLGRG